MLPRPLQLSRPRAAVSSTSSQAGKAGLPDSSGGSGLTQSPGDEASDFKMAPG